MERFNLKDRVVLVSGAASGIGEETARRLVASGARVALIDLDRDGLERVAADLGPNAAACSADVTDREGLDRAMAASRDRLGPIDVVVANAGVAPPCQPLLTINEKAFERTIEVNVIGVWRTIRAALPDVVAQRGHVLVVSSIYAFFNGLLNSPYAMSKAAVEQLGRALRVELADHGATAGVAYLGFVDTPMVRTAFANPQVNRVREALPRWFSKPIPVADAADALVRGIENRSAIVTAPRWVPAAMRLRGILAGLDGRLAGDSRIAAAVREAESVAEG